MARERAKLHAEVKENLLRQAASQDREELVLLRTRYASLPMLFCISTLCLWDYYIQSGAGTWCP